MANKSFVDSVGNWVNLEACQKFPSQQTVIPGATTPAPNVLVKTRLGNFFEVSKGPNGKAQYNPLGPAEVEAFCEINSYKAEQVIGDPIEVNAETGLGPGIDGEM